MSKRQDSSRSGKSGDIDADHPLESLMDDALAAADDGRLSVGDLLDAFGSRGFGPLLTIFALIGLVPPIGGIPGVPSAMGALIMLMSIQLVFGRTHPWVPTFLEERSVSVDKVRKMQSKAVSILKKIDTLIAPRMQWATGNLGQRLAAVACCIMALAMPPLELLPFAAAGPAAVIALFGVALTARDGLLMVIGTVLFVAVLGLFGPQAVGALSSGSFF